MPKGNCQAEILLSASSPFIMSNVNGTCIRKNYLLLCQTFCTIVWYINMSCWQVNQSLDVQVKLTICNGLIVIWLTWCWMEYDKKQHFIVSNFIICVGYKILRNIPCRYPTNICLCFYTCVIMISYIVFVPHSQLC